MNFEAVEKKFACKKRVVILNNEALLSDGKKFQIILQLCLSINLDRKKIFWFKLWEWQDLDKIEW